MKNFKILFLFLSLILIFEITASKEANAAACTVTNGVYSETEIKSGCEATPDFYEIVIYKMYLCTSTPTIPTVTAAADLTNCSQIFNSDAGATANVAQNSDVDLTGTYTRPPDGTYTHGYAMMDNTFGITAAIQIDGSMDGQASGSGVFCRTVSGSGNHTKASGSHTDESVCSATEVAAGKYTETLTHFGELRSAAGAALPKPGDPSWSGGLVLEDIRRQTTSARCEDLMAVIRSVGGDNGWFAFNRLWAVRGFIDKIIGGVGLRRGRRHPTELRPGDTVDFFSVVAIDDSSIRLRAEMRLPGHAWLEWEVESGAAQTVVSQRALFVPRGLLGRIYWYALLPAHIPIFRKMLSGIVAAAEGRQNQQKVAP